MGFKVHLHDLRSRDTRFPQMGHHQLQQAGFAAAPNSRHYLYRFCVAKRDDFIQIQISSFELAAVYHDASLLTTRL